MSLSPELIIAEADRLVARAERAMKRHGASRDEHARALRQLQKLRLYRAVLTGKQSVAALMPKNMLRRADFPVA